MQRSTRYVVQTGGCGRLLGILCIVFGGLFLLTYYGVIPHRISKWWPLVIVAFGVFLLIRHYWLWFRNRPKKYEVLDPLSPTLGQPPRDHSPGTPAAAVLVLVVGAYCLLRYTFNVINLGVLLALLLIVLGVMFLAGNARARMRRP
jgi:hypothetical protein